MFGNLKNKIGDVADLKKYTSPQMLINSLGSSRQRSAQHTPGSRTPKSSQHSREPSISSPHATEGLNLHSSHEKSLVLQDSVELEKEILKLKSALESQQDASLKKLESKESEWKKRLQDALKMVTNLEKDLNTSVEREKELQIQLKQKDKQRVEASADLMVSQEKYKELEKRLYDLQENYDQMEGLSTQEVSKIKHLLLNTNSELEMLKDEIAKKNQEINTLQNRMQTFSGLEKRVASYSEEKMEFETKVAGLEQKLFSSNQKLNIQEKSYSEQIEHLHEKISSLENRSKNNSLEETEKVQSLIQERDVVEHRLEEARQQLSNIKSSWSEKISSLEMQIQNLNKKISEDQSELKSSEHMISKLKEEIYQKDTSHLKQTEESKQEVTQLQNKIQKLEGNFESYKLQSNELLSQKDKEIKDIRKKLRHEEERFTQSQESLHSKEKVLSESQSELEKAEEELQILRQNYGVLQEDFAHLVSSTSTLQESFNSERRQRNSSQKEAEALQAKLDTTSSEKLKLSANLDIYLSKVENYELELNHLKMSSVEKAANIAKLKEELVTANQKAEEATSSLLTLEEQFDAKVEQSSLVKELKEEIKALQDEVSEKKQMLKVQGQRLADMKKTVQKELKIHPGMLESSDAHKNTSPRNSASSAPVSSHIPQTHLFDSGSNMPLQSYDSSILNGEIEIDRINLEYLKHVVLKFITLKDYESVQLTKALATLLHMSRDEEALLKETLEWKMSWFGSKPSGQ